MFYENNKISFASKDYDLLETIKSNLNSRHKISKCNGHFQLQINNKTLYNDLLKRGGTPRKSLTIQFPEVPEGFLSDFIRGYLDGDGSNFIHIDNRGNGYRYLVTSFVGNIDFLIVLKDKIEELANINATSLCHVTNCDSRIYQLTYFNKKAIALGNYIYKDSENLRLERKFKIYDQMKKEYLKKLGEDER